MSWYVVDMELGETKEGHFRALVEANNQPQAFRRFAENYGVARPATVPEVIEMTRNGCDVISGPGRPEQLDIIEDGPGEPELPKVTNIVPEARRQPMHQDEYLRGIMKGEAVPEAPAASAKGESRTEAPQQVAAAGASGSLKKASSVFGAGFGPRAEPDVG